MLYYWLTNPFVHPRNLLLLVFPMYVFVHQFMFCFLPCVSYFIACWFHFFHLQLFIYWLFLLCLQNLFFIPSNLLFIYWSIVYFPFIYLFIFCTHFVLFSHVSTHLFIYWSYIVCLKVFISVCLFFFVPVIASYLLFISWSIFRKHAYLLIIHSLFTESFLWPPSDLTDIIILTDYGIYLSESL